MTVRSFHPAATAAKYSWSRLAAMTAGLLLATVCAGGSAFAADDCGAKPAHSASTQCLEHRPRAGGHSGSRTQKTAARTRAGETASLSDGDELTPVSPVVSSSAALVAPPRAAPMAEHVGLPSLTLPASTPVHRLGRGDDRWPPSAGTLAVSALSAGAFQGTPHPVGGLVHGGGLPSVPTAFAWAILLMGVVGLIVIARQPGVARAQAWAMSPLPSSVTRSAAGVRAVDRVDPSRYTEGPARRSHQGHFVRAATAHFGS